jgi:undecaprenyl-diphosphatase
MTRQIGFLAAGAVLVLIVLLLGWTVAGPVAGATDRSIEAALALRQGVAPDALIGFWRAVSWVDGGVQRYLVLLALAFVLFWQGRWQSGAALVIATLLSGFASDALKDMFERPRPDLVPHLDHVSSLSFPSGHATSAVAIFVLFAMLMPTAQRGRWLAGGLLAAFLTGWSRIALGVHWPSDVLGGWILGGAFVLFALALLPKPSQA